MKTIIAGSRDIFPSALQIDSIVDESGFEISEVVCGEARGVDTSGSNWAWFYKIPQKSFPADWKKFGAAAGPIRNREMADYADALILIWDGKSRGSKNMLEEATKRGLKIHKHIWKS